MDIRSVTDEEFLAFATTLERAFGQDVDPSAADVWRAFVEPERRLAVFEAGEIVATAGALSFELTVPGLATVPAAGVTAVSVVATHRRRGMLRRMMEVQLDDVAARGEPVAVLTASESLLYSRYGYGWATSHAELVIDRAHSQFVRPPAMGGRMRMVDLETAGKLLPPVHDRARRRQPGDLSRTQGWWHVILSDLPSERAGATAMFVVVHESEAGEVDGYATYRLKPEWVHGVAGGEVIVADLVADDAEVEAALLRFVLDQDLAATVRFQYRPADDPFRRRLADPRRLRVEGVADHIWVRLLDIPAALSARRYGSGEAITLAVHDAFRPAASGVYRLEGGTCERAPDGTAADLEVAVEDLGSAYLGGASFTALAAAGRVRELVPGALARADDLFRSLPGEPAPFCRTGF